MKSKDGKSPDMSDWENRVLCSDGNCIGSAPSKMSSARIVDRLLSAITLATAQA